MSGADAEMVRKFGGSNAGAGSAVEEKFTSLQPTYEDSVPDEADDWEQEREQYGS